MSVPDQHGEAGVFPPKNPSLLLVTEPCPLPPFQPDHPQFQKISPRFSLSPPERTRLPSVLCPTQMPLPLLGYRRNLTDNIPPFTSGSPGGACQSQLLNCWALQQPQQQWLASLAVTLDGISIVTLTPIIEACMVWAAAAVCESKEK